MDSKDLQQIAADAGKIVSVAFKLKGGILNAVSFIGPILDLKSVNFEAALAELKSLSATDLVVVEKVFFLNLQVDDAALQAKLQAGEGYLEEAIGLIVQAVELVQKAKDFEGRVQQFFSL